MLYRLIMLFKKKEFVNELHTFYICTKSILNVIRRIFLHALINFGPFRIRYVLGEEIAHDVIALCLGKK